MKPISETHPDAAFVVQDPTGHRYAVYADGRVEGFGEGCVIFNRVPAMIQRATAEASLEEHHYARRHG
jgi:hypothetical protein